MSDIRRLLNPFVTTFQKALTLEMEAMQRRFGPSLAVPLISGRALDLNSPTVKIYSFRMAEPNDKITAHLECTLQVDGTDVQVVVLAIDKDQLTLSCKHEIDLNSQTHALMIYPWFLYEQLQLALDSLLETKDFHVANALMLFGRHPVERQPQPMRLAHEQLNASQRRAIQLCCDSNLAFIWGPPGTGKTTTLGHIVAELLALGHRIAVTSTTNAAVDQVLAKFAELDDMQPYFERGHIVRLGQTQDETFGASLREVTASRGGQIQRQMVAFTERCVALEYRISACSMILDRMLAETQSQQLGLFNAGPTALVVDFSPAFSAKHSNALRKVTLEEQIEILQRRKRRMEALVDGYRKRIAGCRKEFSNQEQKVVQQARVVLTTSTNMYISQFLKEERFDVVIVEEAGMTLLPALFFCASVARHKVIMVGDPKQLPAIVQSDDDFARKFLGKNIFDVTIANLDDSDLVVMLDVQYRMHPVLGDLVSNVYYGGNLHNAASTADRAVLAARHPFPDMPVVVIDTQGQTTCSTHQGQFSRFNRTTATLCANLAVEAVRSGIASVGIITPYAEQSRLIREMMARFPAEAAAIECRTVHRFQGSERDMIILDTVDTAPLAPGVLLASTGPGSAAANLVNVSISRARGKLIIVSDVAYFRRTAPSGAITHILNQAIARGLHVGMPASQ